MAGSGAKSRLEFWRVDVRGGREARASSDWLAGAWRLLPAPPDTCLWLPRVQDSNAKCQVLHWRANRQLAFVKF